MTQVIVAREGPLAIFGEDEDGRTYVLTGENTAQSAINASIAATSAAAANDAKDIVTGFQNYYATRAAGASATPTGGIFTSDEEGAMAWYRRTATAPNYIRIDYVATKTYIDAKSTALASTSLGVGASLVGTYGGGTVQDTVDLYNCTAAAIASRTIPAPILAFTLTDRDGARAEAVPSGTGTLPASGLGKWHFVDAGGRRWWITSLLTTRALGASVDGIANDIAVSKELVEVAAPFLKRAAYFSAGIHLLTRTSASDVIYIKAGVRVVLMPGAQIKGALNLSGYYLPFFAFVDLGYAGAQLSGSNEKHFILTNRLTYGAGQDFPVADITGAVEDKRLGSAADVRSDTYASCVVIIASHNISVRGIGCESIDGHNWVAGAAFAHALLASSGTCHNLIYDDLDADDVVNCALILGGKGGYRGFVRYGRASQDIGIPGHARYDYGWELTIGDTLDTGEETGADLTKQISHTVSYSGSGPATIGRITSNRRTGPFNVKFCYKGCVVDGISWYPAPLRSGGTELVASQPRVFGVTKQAIDNAKIIIRNMTLDSTGADIAMVGGDFGPGSLIEGTITRKDTTATNEGFITLGASVRQKYKLRLVQEGTVDPTISIKLNDIATYHTIDLDLVNFKRGAPIVQVINGTAYLADCVIIIQRQYDSAGQALPAFGDPATIWYGATTDLHRTQNIMCYPDGWSCWYKDAAAAASFTLSFPLPRAVCDAQIMTSCDTYVSAQYFERVEEWKVGAMRPRNRSGTQLVLAALVSGTTIGLNNTTYTYALTPSLDAVSIAVTVTGATAQANGSRTFFSTRIRRGQV